VYNHFLNERKEQYQKDKKSDNYYAQAKTLTELKKDEYYKWLKEVNSQTIQFSENGLVNVVKLMIGILMQVKTF